MATGITYKEAERILLRNGFVLVRTGGHKIFKRNDLTITLHSSGNLNPWLSNQIVKGKFESLAIRGKQL